MIKYHIFWLYIYVQLDKNGKHIVMLLIIMTHKKQMYENLHYFDLRFINLGQVQICDKICFSERNI